MAPARSPNPTCLFDDDLMLSWLFKKRGNADAPPALPIPAHAAKPPTARRPAAAAPDGPAGEDWPTRLRAAQGDDAALLLVAQAAVALEIKMAAVEALTTESALRQAEREFRSHDRKVHRLAKQRLGAAVERRTARAQAQALLLRLRALTDEDWVPLNHVAELDRDWQALPVHALEPGPCAEFAEQRARLDVQMRERDDARQHLQRWTADAKRFLAAWPGVSAAAAQHGTASDFAELGHAVRGLRTSRPALAATAELDQALAKALWSTELLQARLAELEALQAPAADSTQASPGAPAPPEGATAGDAAPLGLDAELARLVDQRHEQWLRASQPARPTVAIAAPAADKPRRPAPSEAEVAELWLQIEARVQQAEAGLAEGQLGAMQQHLQAIDGALTKMTAALPDALRARLQALRTERGRLQDWQRWGGARVRDELAAEAVELARRTLAVADPEAPPAPKLNLQAHGESIQTLRKRWKDLDHQGSVASAEQWRRFDAALQTAHQPVAAQQAALKAARLENLAAREALLDALEAPARPESPAEPEAAAAAADAAPDWKERARELDRFQTAWRKLGPVEHTVPIASRQALQRRLQTAVARIEAPLQAARAAAAADREQLIAHAEGLVRDGGGGPGHELARQVRELQFHWQEQARRLPLPRALEGVLWARFKAATDAVFAQRDAAFAARDAAFAARDAELAANLAAREALLQRLSALDANGPLADIERALAEIDRAWRQDSALPRGASEALEARFRAARAVASQLLTAGVVQRWQAQCDTLAVNLALCEQREDLGAVAAEAAGLGQRQAAHDTLPVKWEQALALRWSRPVEAGPLPAAEVEDGLLRLEMALELPAAPERLAARQQLKLRALKDAMEGRASPKQGPAAQAGWLLMVLRQAGLDAAQRERLRAIVAALRRAPPGSLGGG